MELRERRCTASWSTPKMEPKVEREWQNQLELIKGNGKYRKIG